MTEPLSPEDRQRLETLFARAAELPAGEHEDFLENECGDSGALREELARLLAGMVGEDHMTRLKPGAPLQPGTRIGAYKLLESIGEGGMGEVYAAEQLEPVKRRVALKVIKLGMDSAQITARFEAERQALARMTHPNIAQVYDAGTTDDGRPFFVMEFVAGVPITDYCDRRRLSTRERLDLFLDICSGVQHAHQKGIIHRDLKPSNLLVTEQDGRASAKIIDFGVARATTGRLAERTLHTMAGQVLGTLDYMSPEQADPTAIDIDTRSDVYSLGVVLYELVAGMLPFARETLLHAGFLEMIRVIKEEQPPKPSTRLASTVTEAAAHNRRANSRSLIRELEGDLDWIALKALEKDPARRYGSPSELAADLRRHLADEPVLAGRPGLLYRARKFVLRNRIAVAAGVLVAVSAVVGILGVISGRIEAEATTRMALSLKDHRRLDQLEAEAETLWPPYPDKIGAMEAWLVRARAVASRLSGHRENLEAMRRSDNLDAEDRQFLISQLEDLTARLAKFEAAMLDKAATTASYGWGVAKRLAKARELKAGFAEGGQYQRAWATCLDEIHAANPGLTLTDRDQMGLLPLGPDPKSERFEFADLITGEPGRRVDNKSIEMSEGMGVVLVLIPGRSFEMGSPFGKSRAQDALPHDVTLSAYFLSKFEMTQGQWQRLTGDNPSNFRPDNWDPQWLESGKGSLRHPVEQVRWLDCMKWLPRAGLALPSEAQWEYGARAGTRTRFWAGPNATSLKDVANVRDDYGKKHGMSQWPRWHDNIHDGSTVHWPVGSSRRANDFGLLDVHGNVQEWCLDGYDPLFYTRSKDATNPVSPWEGATRLVARGGNWRVFASEGNSIQRHFWPPDFRGHALGVRPGRAIGGR